MVRLQHTRPAALLLLSTLTFGTGCSRSDAGGPPRPGELVVRRGELVQSFVLTGEIRSRNSEIIAVPRLPEWQTTIQWLAEDGAIVSEGDRVVELDNTSFASRLDQRQLAVTQAENELARFDASSAAQIEEREFEFERRRIDLEKAKIAAAVPAEIISRREWEEAQLALERGETEFRKAEELLRSAKTGQAADRRNHELNLAEARRELETSEQAIESLVLTAPANGVFLIRDHPWEGRRMQIGDRVFVGLPLAEIPDPSALVVEANLWDVDDGRIAAGDPVEIVVDAWPDTRWTGRVTSIAQVAQETERQSLRRSFTTTIELDEIDSERMRPGYSVRIHVPRVLARDALLVPRSSVQQSEGEGTVTLHDGRRRKVALGPCNAQDCAVTSGVREGEQLGRSEVTDADD